MLTPAIQKIIIPIVAVVVISALAYFGYTTFFKGGSAGEGAVATSTMESEGQDISILVEKLKTISLNQNIFSSALFRNLKDFSQPITPELQGRSNPFALIGSDFSTPANTSVSTTTRR